MSSNISNVNDPPPDYFDISIVPNAAVLFHDASLETNGISQAKIERNRKGVVSFDSLIDRNPDQLWLYFMTYLSEKLTFHITIYGYYTENYTTSHTTTDADGTTRTYEENHTRDVTEFSFTIDASQFINDQWWRIAVVSSHEAIRNNEIVTVRTAIEQYTQSEKSIKNIILHKQVHGWSMNLLRARLVNLVGSTGYSNSIGIIFNFQNYRIEAQSSSRLNTISKSLWMRALCILSCLWIIFAPIYCCLKAAGSTRDKIVADFTFSRPLETFLHLNWSLVYNAVAARSFKNFMAVFQ